MKIKQNLIECVCGPARKEDYEKNTEFNQEINRIIDTSWQ